MKVKNQKKMKIQIGRKNKNLAKMTKLVDKYFFDFDIKPVSTDVNILNLNIYCLQNKNFKDILKLHTLVFKPNRFKIFLKKLKMLKHLYSILIL